jgi:hypothetical protein
MALAISNTPNGPVIRNRPNRPLSEFGDCTLMAFFHGLPLGGIEALAFWRNLEDLV